MVSGKWILIFHWHQVLREMYEVSSKGKVRNVCKGRHANNFANAKSKE